MLGTTRSIPMLLCTSLLVIFSISDGINAGYSLCPSPSLAILYMYIHVYLIIFNQIDCS